MKTISIGQVNDSNVYAIATTEIDGNITLTPLTEADMEYVSPDYCIRCDSGVYPGVTDVDAYVCCVAQSILRRKRL
jgi:hypothetical protein